MPRVVRIHRAFAADMRKHAAWLVENDREEWAKSLFRGIEEVAALLARFPSAAPMLKEDERLVLRKVIFRRLPYVAWYAHTKPPGDVWLLRLFGARQDRDDPDPSSWDL